MVVFLCLIRCCEETGIEVELGEKLFNAFPKEDWEHKLLIVLKKHFALIRGAYPGAL